MFFDQMLLPSPYSTSLARVTASSVVWNRVTVSTGPKISCLNAGIDGVTPSMIVGWT